jgi:quercetin dioxygenase-like cupin family protein
MAGVSGPKRSARRIVHADLPIVPSPSGLPSQHIVSSAVGSETIFVGQQWLEPGERVLLHTHPVEEALTFLAGSGEATLGEEIVPIGPSVSLFIPPGVVHGFRNAGETTLHVLIVFQGPRFAETVICEKQSVS